MTSKHEASPNHNSLKFSTLLILFLLVNLPNVNYGKGSRYCGFDCEAPAPGIFGGSTLNGGFAGTFYTGSQISAKAFAPVDSLQVCVQSKFAKSDVALSAFLQPQTIMYAKTYDVIVVCPSDAADDGASGTINLVSIEQYNGLLSIKKSVSFGSLLDLAQLAGPIGSIEGFVVTGEYTVINTENFVFLLESFGLGLTWAFKLPENSVSTGLPLITFGVGNFVATTLSNGNILKIDALTHSYEVVEVAKDGKSVKNVLGFNAVDASGNFYFCSEEGVVAVKLITSVGFPKIEVLPLTGCSAFALTDENKILVASGNKLYDLPRSLFDVVDAEDGQPININNYVAAEFGTEEVITAISFAVFTDSSSILNVRTILALNTGVEVLNTQPLISKSAFVKTAFYETNLDGKRGDSDSTGAVVSVPAVTATGDPLFATKERIYGPREIVFFTPDVAGLKITGDFELTTSPVMFSRSSLLQVTKSGTAVLYSYCNRWTLGDELPSDKACPVGDLPERNQLDPALIILASAGSAVFLPLSMYACKKTKYFKSERNNDITDNENSDVDEDEDGADDDQVAHK